LANAEALAKSDLFRGKQAVHKRTMAIGLINAQLVSSQRVGRRAKLAANSR
jgi:hypothetical protein